MRETITHDGNLRGRRVRIFLGAAGTQIRTGVVLVDRGETLIVEYRTGLTGSERGLDHRNKIVRRERVEVLV